MTVAVTEETAALLRRPTGRHSASTFHQSDGCFDRSSQICFPAGDFSVEAPDGVRILMRSRLFTDSESKQLEATKTPV
jgi:uncharacterized protein